MKNIAIIPARGGSKRIPRKNIKEFLGKPIIAYSIEAALKSGLFDKVIVSTDDLEIAEIAKKYGADVPFLRSENTSNDYATLRDVLLEVTSKLSLYGEYYDNMCCILATCPLVTEQMLINGYNKLMSNNSFSSVYPIVQFSYPIQRCLKLDNEGVISMKWKEFENSRSQDLEPLYHDSGTFYWHRVELWKQGVVKKGSIIMDELLVQDIDTETDWKLAELKYSILYDK